MQYLRLRTMQQIAVALAKADVEGWAIFGGLFVSCFAHPNYRQRYSDITLTNLDCIFDETVCNDCPVHKGHFVIVSLIKTKN